MLSLRQKLLVGFGGLLLIITVIGMKNILQVTDLGGAIDSILRENYRSVIACQTMKESLERMDDGSLSIILGNRKEGFDIIDKESIHFEKALNIELNNITMPGEGEMAHHLEGLFAQYKSIIISMKDPSLSSERLHKIYFTDLKQLFGEIKSTADTILTMNQKNMYDESQQAKRTGTTARHEMYILLLIGASVAVVYVSLIGKWILRPIKHLKASVDEIRHGNLDLVVSSDTHDEIGQLSDAFNEMTASLRELRRSDEAKLVRMQQSTQQTFNSLPNAVALVDQDGKVEAATDTAGNLFGLKRGVQIMNLHITWLKDLFKDAIGGNHPTSQLKNAPVIQHFVNAQEHYFQPTAVPILNNWKQISGAILVMNDVTKQLEQDELKREFLSTVSHQLKTPLTSVRMALHILLEEKIGSLTPKQADLLTAAREDSDRLYGVIENLLDISRIESGKIEMNIQSVPVGQLIRSAAESFQASARDRNIDLSMVLADNTPDVIADTTQIEHVFANLLTNSLKYTPAGGTITISAETEKEHVRFLVADTGSGIPAQYLAQVFDQFFRVPGQETKTGTGLGLTIVREIVQAHEGTVRAESTPGKGSIFSFTIPRSDKIKSYTKEEEEQTWLI
ncbi:MAG: HAMP domain-containing protein [Deltaproteobacteria bacterium]|nr:HAMP domain-containing protein [Deltaproteobacteria bacterium]